MARTRRDEGRREARDGVGRGAGMRRGVGDDGIKISLKYEIVKEQIKQRPF